MSLKNLSAKIRIPKILENKLNNKKISIIYNRFAKSLNVKDPFIVAVSGGADSLALAFLSKIYSIKQQVASKFFVVDHKLRKGSTKEAKIVKQVLKKFLINVEILTWKGKKPKSNIQSLARKKRYDLLYNVCKKNKIDNIFLGHHRDDLFENFFIRILRGSGLNGLISLNKKNKINNINLYRPLINEKKENLEFLSKYVFNYYAKDPSNKNEKFLRIKVRNLIKDLQDNGLDKKKFKKTINNLRYANDAISFYVTKNLQKNVSFLSKRNKLILNKDFFLQPKEVTFRSLSESIKLIGKKHYPVRGKKLDKVIDEIKNNTVLKLTLGGCIIQKLSQTVIISKEH
tara:strand:+ start:69 stop:1097 length:1029 start_codon:yes stop_codon:yes gene_type:complete